MAVKDQYPSLMSTLYPGVMATEPRLFGTLDAMWLAFQALANDKTPVINDDFVFPCLLCRRACGHPLRRGPVPRDQGQTPSQSPAWQTGSRNNPVVMNVSKSPRLHRPLARHFLQLLAPRRAL